MTNNKRSSDLFKDMESLNEEDLIVEDGMGEIQGEVLGSFNFTEGNQVNRTLLTQEQIAAARLEREKEKERQEKIRQRREAREREKNTPKAPAEEKMDNRKNTGYAPGSTPPINGEYFTLKRSYNFRESTQRKLMEIKFNHPDVNVYYNTLLDEAICLLHEKYCGKK